MAFLERMRAAAAEPAKPICETSGRAIARVDLGTMNSWRRQARRSVEQCQPTFDKKLSSSRLKTSAL